MSELDLMGDLLEAGERGTSLADSVRLDINNPEIENELKRFYNKYPDAKFTVEEDKVTFEIPKKGINVNLDELNELYKKGKFEDIAKKLNYPNTDEAKTYIDSMKSTWEQSNAGQLNEFGNNVEANVEHLENLPIPQSTDELMEQIEKASGSQAAEELEGKLTEYKEAVDDVKEGKTEKAKSMYDKLSETTKKMIKFAAFLALIVFAGYEFTKFISGLAHKLSGCFAAGPNGICKIRELTCDNDDLTSDSTFCQACQKFDCSDLPAGTPGWVPLKAASCSCDPTKKADFPGQYCPDAPQSQNTCGGKNPACPIKPAAQMEDYYGPVIQAGVVADCSQAISACPNASGCVSRVEACKGNNSHCSELCNNESLNLPASISVQCKVTSWWQALGHFAGDIIKPVVDPLKNLLSGALKGLIWIALIIVGIIGAFFVIKELWAATGNSGKGSGNVSKK